MSEQKIMDKSENVSTDLNKQDKLSTWTMVTDRKWIVLVLLMLVSVGIYYQCTSFRYVLDDQIVITDNSFTKKGFSGIYELFTTESMTGYFGEQKNLVEGNRYRPLSLVTFAIEYDLMGGLNPSLSHWINILIYGLTGFLIFMLMRRFLSSSNKWKEQSGVISLAIALLFLSHPIHVEAVANIKGRDELMSMLFSLSTLILMMRYVKDHSLKWLIGANLAYFLGLLSKENTITFLAVIPLSLYFFASKNWVDSIKATLSFIGTTILYLILRFTVSGVPKLGQAANDLMNNPFLEMNGVEKMSTIMYTLGLYIKLLLVPYPLTHDYYPYTIPIMNLGDWQVWLSILIYGFLLVWALKKMKQRSLIGYGILFYLLTLTIVSNIVINLGTFMNDRFVYISSLGFCIALVILAIKWLNKIGKSKNIVGVGLFSTLFIAFSFLSFTRVPAWESAMTLNRSAIKVSYNSARANTFMSTALYKEGLATKDRERKMEIMKEALPYAKRSCEIYPTYYNGNLMYAGIASEIFKLDHKIDDFISVFEQTMKTRPDISYISEFAEYMSGRTVHTEKLVSMYHRVGESLIARNKRFDAKWAAHYLNKALALKKSNQKTILLLSQAHELMGDMNSANKYKNLLRKNTN